MGSIRILQLSDLLVGSSDFSMPAVLKAYKACIKDQELQRFDYLVICGNLTADGRDESFEEAERFLESLAAECLHTDGSRLRILIVPGRLDVGLESIGDEPNYNAFATFHDRFFARFIERGEVRMFHQAEVMLRELKELTLIGICYWNLELPPGANDSFSTAVQQVVSMVTDLDLRYRDSTPTLLVTAESPVLARSMHTRLREEDLRTDIEKRINVTLHCFGESDATCLSFEPFIYQHIGLSTGPRHSKGLWPLRLNAIKLRPRSYDASGDEPSLRLTIYECLRPDSAWHPAKVIKGELNRLLAKKYPPYQTAAIHHLGLLARIKKWLRKPRGGMLLVRGAPGSGVEKLANTLVGRQKIGGRWATLITTSWNSYGIMSHKISEVGEALLNHKSRIVRRHEHRIPIVILGDQVFNRTYGWEKNDQWEKEIGKQLRRLMDFEAIYLYVIDSFQSFPARIRREFFSDEIHISALTPAALNRLIDEYVFRFPLVTRFAYQYLNNLSGGYAGIAETLLERAETTFVAWPGAISIQRGISYRLLKMAAQAEIQAHDLIGSIEDCPAGADIRPYIEELVSERADTEGWEENLHADPIKVGLPSLVDYVCKRGSRKDVELLTLELRKTLAILAAHGLLEPSPEEMDSYYLRVVAPFMAKQSGYSMFLAYPGKADKQAQDLKKRIEEAGRRLKKQIGIYFFDEAELRGGHLTSQLREDLQSANNLVVLFDREYEGWVESEVHWWFEFWKSRIPEGAAMGIPISLGGAVGTPPPPPLSGFIELDLSTHDLASVAERVAELVVSLPGDWD